MQKVRHQLHQIAQSPINAFISTSPQTAELQARLCDQTHEQGGRLGPLHGVTVGVKDLIDVAGMRTTMGSAQYQHHVAPRDAAAVAALREAGAVVLGKTNTHEFAYGSSGDRSWFGPVRNPHDPSRMSGGSSSGSAAAVAAGLCDVALGSDTSASVRVPAALCGVVGLKPTFDLLSRDGVFDLAQSLDHVGTITPNVHSNAQLLEVLTGRPGAYTARMNRGVAGWRIGVVTRFYGEYISTPVQQAFEQALATLEAAGACVVPVDIPPIQDIFDAQQLVLKAEAYANHRAALEQHHPYSDEVRERLFTGRDVSAADYLAAKAYQPVARASFDSALSQVDVLLTPTVGILAPAIEERQTEVNGAMHRTFWLLTRLTAPTNFTGHPSLSVPSGRHDGLPIGMQIIGRHGDEAVLFQAGRALEAAQA